MQRLVAGQSTEQPPQPMSSPRKINLKILKVGEGLRLSNNPQAISTPRLKGYRNPGHGFRHRVRSARTKLPGWGLQGHAPGTCYLHSCPTPPTLTPPTHSRPRHTAGSITAHPAPTLQPRYLWPIPTPLAHPKAGPIQATHTATKSSPHHTGSTGLPRYCPGATADRSSPPCSLEDLLVNTSPLSRSLQAGNS